MNNVLNTLEIAHAAQVAALKSYDNVLLGAGHVVMPPHVTGMALAIETDRERKIIGTKLVPLDRAHLLEKSDAYRVAASTTNGAGEQYVAMHIRAALAQDIIEIERCIAAVTA
jgi:hypothetical protein